MKHDEEIRYARHISLPEIGKEGQARLLHAKILVIGAGGLGSPALLYLAASGIGTIGIVDNDKVDLSNLQRQILHETYDIGRPKTESASAALHDLNPDIQIHCHPTKLDVTNSNALIKQYDMVVDGSDNIQTRLLVNDTCTQLNKTLVSAAIHGFTGQLSTFKAYLGTPHPCYRCLYPDIEGASMPTCAESGILGGVAGVMGSWQAVEIVKELLGIGESLSGSLIRYNALSATIKKVALYKDPACINCAETHA